RSYGPSPEVPWGTLTRATTRAYFVPDIVKKKWEGPLRDHGLSERVAMFSGLDPSGHVPLNLAEFLSEAVCRPDVAAEQVTVTQMKHIGWLALTVVIVVAALPFVLSRS